MYQPNLPLEAGRYVTASKEHIALSLEAATEGMVLLKNENNILPLKNGSRITLFGRGSFDYVKGGGGSGDVTVSYVHNLYDGFKTLEDKVQVYEPVANFYKKNVEEMTQLIRKYVEEGRSTPGKKSANDTSNSWEQIENFMQ